MRRCIPPLPFRHTSLEPLSNPCLQLLRCSFGLHRQGSGCDGSATGTDSGKHAAVLVMCDVLYPDSSPHITNTRALLVKLLTPDVVAEKPMFGFEQARLLSIVFLLMRVAFQPKCVSRQHDAVYVSLICSMRVPQCSPDGHVHPWL